MTKRTWKVNLFAREGGETREVRHEWPADVFIQGGHSGVVLGRKGKPGYVTAYFEAFPRGKDQTFIRGEGENLDVAEDKAWEKFERIRACQHDTGFEAKGYVNGYGFCKGCGMGRSEVIEPDKPCHVCGIKTYYSFDNDEKVFGCEKHPIKSSLAEWFENRLKSGFAER